MTNPREPTYNRPRRGANPSNPAIVPFDRCFLEPYVYNPKEVDILVEVSLNRMLDHGHKPWQNESYAVLTNLQVQPECIETIYCLNTRVIVY